MAKSFNKKTQQKWSARERKVIQITSYPRGGDVLRVVLMTTGNLVTDGKLQFTHGKIQGKKSLSSLGTQT